MAVSVTSANGMTTVVVALVSERPHPPPGIVADGGSTAAYKKLAVRYRRPSNRVGRPLEPVAAAGAVDGQESAAHRRGSHTPCRKRQNCRVTRMRNMDQRLTHNIRRAQHCRRKAPLRCRRDRRAPTDSATFVRLHGRYHRSWQHTTHIPSEAGSSVPPSKW